MHIPGSQFPSNVLCSQVSLQLLHVCVCPSETDSPTTAVVSARDASCPFSLGSLHLHVCAGVIYV